MTTAAHVTTLGTGPVPGLALHCTLAHSGAWKGVASELAGDVTLVAPDMPNHGRSPDWDGTVDLPELAYSYALQGLDRPRHLFGHSFGGILALMIAVRRPDLVLSLTMFEPVLFCIAKADDPASMEAHDAKSADFSRYIAAGDFEQAARAFNRMWSDGPRWAQMPERTRAAMTRAIRIVPECGPLLMEDTAGLLPGLGNVACPSLVMHGAKAEPAVVATNAGLVARLPDARGCVIAEAGHMAPITHAPAVAAAWREFLVEIGALS